MDWSLGNRAPASPYIDPFRHKCPICSGVTVNTYFPVRERLGDVGTAKAEMDIDIFDGGICGRCTPDALPRRSNLYRYYTVDGTRIREMIFIRIHESHPEKKEDEWMYVKVDENDKVVGRMYIETVEKKKVGGRMYIEAVEKKKVGGRMYIEADESKEVGAWIFMEADEINKALRWLRIDAKE